MTRRPLDFYLVPESSPWPPLRDEWLCAAERELGFGLPRELVQLLRIQNGGQLRYDSCAANVEERDHVSIHEIRGIGPNERDGLRFNQYFLDEWSLPSALVLLDGNGHEWIALDYRCSTNGPAVCWVDAESSRTIQLASTFAAFLDKLLRGDHRVCFGFAESVSTVASQLASVLGLRFVESRLVTDSLEAQHPVWRDEFGEPARVWVEPNNLRFADGFPEYPNCQTITRVDLLVEHRPALVAAMSGLGCDAELVHTPPWKQG